MLFLESQNYLIIKKMHLYICYTVLKEIVLKTHIYSVQCRSCVFGLGQELSQRRKDESQAFTRIDPVPSVVIVSSLKNK